MQELIDWSLERGDDALVDDYQRNHSLEYTPNGGSRDLRECIAATLYAGDNDTITADHILVFPGAQVALQTAMRAIFGGTTTDNNDVHAITFAPGYQSVVMGPALAGAATTRVTQLERSAAHGDWQIDLDAVAAVLNENNTASNSSNTCTVLNEPYNPAGTVMARATQAELIALAQTKNSYILCDEVYRFLEHHPSTDRLPAMAEAYDHGISVATLSKAWGGCGICIGWVATQDVQLLERMADLQYFGTACPSRASELQALMVLRAHERIVERNMDIIRANLALLTQFMADYEEFFHWIPPTAGAIAALRFQGPLSSRELGDALAANGIGIKPAYCFQNVDDSDTIDPDKDYFRVGFGEANIPSALEAFRRFVEENKVEWRNAMKNINTVRP